MSANQARIAALSRRVDDLERVFGRHEAGLNAIATILRLLLAGLGRAPGDL